MYAPLGISLPAASICSAVFFLAGISCIVQWKQFHKFKLYLIMGIGALMRGIGFAVCGATISSGSATTSDSVVYLFFLNVGYGMSMGVSSLALSVWFKNAAAESKPSHHMLWRAVCIWMFPLAIIFGPVLGIASVVELFGVDSQASLNTAKSLRETTSMGFLLDAAITALMAFGCFALAWSRRDKEKGWSDPNIRVGVLGFASCLLAWSASFRVRSMFVDPSISSEENLYYTLQVLPEMLEVLVWAVPGLMVQSSFGSGYDAWFVATLPGGPAAAPTDIESGAVTPPPVEKVSVPKTQLSASPSMMVEVVSLDSATEVRMTVATVGGRPRG